MPTPDGSLADLFGIFLVLLLVAANGFFVAAEFSLVAVRRSRVTELVSAGRANARVLQKAVDNLDANLAATQLGITISSLALGWIGEPALAHLIEPLLAGLPSWLATTGSHAIAVAVAFIIITALHIVLGELAPKSLALQRSEGTALAVVRPLGAVPRAALACDRLPQRLGQSRAAALAACVRAPARKPYILRKS